MDAPRLDVFNLAEHVLAAGARCPDKVALAVVGPARAERWSYARLDRAVRGMAGALAAAGLGPGDRLLLRLGNTVEFPVAFLGAIGAGVVPVPSAAGLTSDEVTRLSRLVAPAATLAAPGIALPEGGAPVLGDLRVMMEHAPANFVTGPADRLAYLVFTSGSSGAPKAVAHAHRAILARRMMHEGWYGLTPDDRLLHAGAFNWTFTLGTGLLDPWSVGATALIPAPGTEPATLPLLLRRHDATILAAAPGVFRKLLAGDAPLDLPRLRHGLSAGEKLPEALRARWRAATGTDLHEALGMSECSTFLSGSPSRPAPEGTLGHAQAGRRLAVLDARGRDAGTGEVGTLGVHRSDPGLMLGYWSEGGALELPLNGDWFETGDRVARRADGAFVYHGRRDDLITAGGFRVSPVEIEAAFHGAPGVEDCAALAVSPKSDTTIIALAFAGDATEDRLGALAARALARYKQPRAYLRLAALPRSPNGKLDRRALAEIVREAMP
ncbi:class I adenylate-forming enzyme family protein [Roseibacterium sp. SDUM158017]|uniref:class I adenylate-forming enzyme family protein n=1 Tax=Roseicyclus salinarum TaxID=3036773 RepID=UPI002415656E|nr:class I adenylate-forming enzyme family protein [Roseibacterium sp. SDUM158017]MDG4648840.1 class I adenylate-forming enzyme family protein [Roseibacterium sp. SDUM158017]